MLSKKEDLMVMIASTIPTAVFVSLASRLVRTVAVSFSVRFGLVVTRPKDFRARRAIKETPKKRRGHVPAGRLTMMLYALLISCSLNRYQQLVICLFNRRKSEGR